MAFLACLLLLTPPAPTSTVAAPAGHVAFQAPRCGPVCFYLIAKLNGKPQSWDEVNRRLGDGGPTATHSFAELSAAAAGIGLQSRGVRTTADQLPSLPLPAIAVVHGPAGSASKHFLVLLRAEPQGAVIVDAPYSPEFLDWNRFATRWTGDLLLFLPSDAEAVKLDGRLAWEGWKARLRFPLFVLGGAALLGAGFLGRRSFMNVVGRAGRKTWLAVGLVALLAGAGATYAAAPRWLFPTPPRCVIPEPSQDLGQFTAATQLHHLAIRNDGDGLLTIKKVHSNCGCVVSKMADPVIPPGGVGRLPLELSVTPGPRRVLLTLETDDPAGPHTAQLHWSGPAHPTLHPLWIEEQAAPAGQPFKRKLQLFYPGGRGAIQPEFVAIEGAGLRIVPGKNDPLAEQYIYTGFVEKIIGVFELEAVMEPPPQPGFQEAAVKLKFRYGQQDLTYPLTVRARFVAPSPAQE